MLDDGAAPLRVGLVGCGLIAQVAHLPALRALDALYSVEALADPSPNVRDRLARRYGVPAAFADHRSLIERTGLDALVVSSPNFTHTSIVNDAIDGGLHVLVEKPLCIVAADAYAIAERARAAELVVQVGYMKRFDPAYEAFIEAVPTLGVPLALHTVTIDPGIGDRLRPSGYVAPEPVPHEAVIDDPAKQVARALGTDDPQHISPFSDAFLGALVHDVNLALSACPGSWHAVDATSRPNGTLAHGCLVRDDDARWCATWARVPTSGTFREDLTLCASTGVARLTFPAPYLGSAPAELVIDGDIEKRHRIPANAYVRQLEHFHACVTRGTPCRASAEQGATDIELLTSLYRAAVRA